MVLLLVHELVVDSESASKLACRYVVGINIALWQNLPLWAYVLLRTKKKKRKFVEWHCGFESLVGHSLTTSKNGSGFRHGTMKKQRLRIPVFHMRL